MTFPERPAFDLVWLLPDIRWTGTVKLENLEIEETHASP